MSSFVSSFFSSITGSPSPSKRRSSSVSKRSSTSGDPALAPPPVFSYPSSASSSRPVSPSPSPQASPSRPGRSRTSTFGTPAQTPLASGSSSSSSLASSEEPYNSTPLRASSSRRNKLGVESPGRVGDEGRTKKRLSAFEEEEENRRDSFRLSGLNQNQQEIDVWAKDFWVTLEDQKNQAIFFANPLSGDCRWLPPHGSYVLPIGKDGHWWELADPNREGSCYYFHTRTKETRWTRPNVPIVIPLWTLFNSPNAIAAPLDTPTLSKSFHAAQSTPSLPSEVLTHTRTISQSFVAYPHPHASDYEAASAAVATSAGVKAARRRSVSVSSPTPAALSTSIMNPFTSLARSLIARPKSSIDVLSSSSPSSTTPSPPRETLQSPSRVSLSSSLAPKRTRPPSFFRKSSAPPAFSNSSDTSPLDGNLECLSTNQLAAEIRLASGESGEAGVKTRSRTRSVPNLLFGLGGKNGGGLEGLKQERPVMPRLRTAIGSPSIDLDAKDRMSPLVSLKHKKSAPILVSSTLYTKRLSHGDHHVLPLPLAHDIELFSIANYASSYFSTKHTEGLLRKRVPFAKMSVHQTTPISHPLLDLPPKLRSNAIRTFKIIQHQMGERSRSVELPSLLPSRSSSNTNLDKLSSPTKGSGLGRRGSQDEKTMILTEVRWLLAVGITEGSMRDEIYMQIIKQLTLSPDLAAVYRGWELLCVLVTTFSPSANLASHLKSFVKSIRDSSSKSMDEDDSIEDKIRIMARHCLIRLEASRPPKSKAPSLYEIESAMIAPFFPTVFSSSLQNIMSLQTVPYPSLRVPIILPFLRTAILALPGALTTEGLFRIPGDQDQVMFLREQIDRGIYALPALGEKDAVDDAAVLCSVLKMWLRELEQPLILEDRYDEALRAAAGEGEGAVSALGEERGTCCDLVRSLPKINRDVIVFVISFIQELLPFQAETKMTDVNFATIFGPNLFRCPADSLPPASSVNDRDVTHVPRQFINSGFEIQFVLSLIRNLVPSEFDALMN